MGCVQVRVVTFLADDAFLQSDLGEADGLAIVTGDENDLLRSGRLADVTCVAKRVEHVFVQASDRGEVEHEAELHSLTLGQVLAQLFEKDVRFTLGDASAEVCFYPGLVRVPIDKVHNRK